MPLIDTLDKRLKLYWSYSGAILNGVPDVVGVVNGAGSIYISCTGSPVLVESLNGKDVDYASEGSVDNSTAILTNPHMKAIRLTASGGDSFATISIKREHHGRL